MNSQLLVLEDKKPFISRMGPCEDLLVNPGFPQHVIDADIVFIFRTLALSFFREDTGLDFPAAINFVLKNEVEQLDYQVKIRGYLAPEKISVKNTQEISSRYISFWSKHEDIYGWTKEDTLQTMIYRIFKQFSQDYYLGDRSFVSFPAEILMILEKRIEGADYALEALFYTDDLETVIKDHKWSEQAKKYALEF